MTADPETIPLLVNSSPDEDVEVPDEKVGTDRRQGGTRVRHGAGNERYTAMAGLVSRMWLPLLVVAVVVVGVVTVLNIRSIFGSDPLLIAPKSSDSAERFNPKVVTYEVFGSGSVAVINYLDLNSQPQRVAETTLPWSLTLSTTAPSATPNILAQGDGGVITCRITVDDEVKDERTATGVAAETYCLVKSA